MKRNKIICECCGAAVEEPLLAKNLLEPPSSEIEPVKTRPWEQEVICPYCGFKYKAMPYTIEAVCEVDPHCHNCGKALDECDEGEDIFVLHTHENAKPAEYKLETSLLPDELYRKVKEAEPEKDHKYFFCSRSCYVAYVKRVKGIKLD